MEEVKQIIIDLQPKLEVDAVREILYSRPKIKDDALYARFRKLGEELQPHRQDEFEASWLFLYLPMMWQERKVCGNFSLTLSHKKEFYLSSQFSSGGISILPGSEENPEPNLTILQELLDFTPAVIEHREVLVEQLFPYSWRMGVVARKYTCDPSKLLDEQEGKKLLQKYQEHQKSAPEITEISVNNYLKTAAIGYRAAFKEKIEQYQLQKRLPANPTAAELHQNFADNRHGGMLDIKDFDSKQMFMEWYQSDKWTGAHPFEIVYSTPHGIYLYPPGFDEFKGYTMSVADDFYNLAFLKMLEALMDVGISVQVNGLEQIIEHCVGNKEIDVNYSGSFGEESFSYDEADEKKKEIFPHIKWDKLFIPQKV